MLRCVQEQDVDQSNARLLPDLLFDHFRVTPLVLVDHDDLNLVRLLFHVTHATSRRWYIHPGSEVTSAGTPAGHMVAGRSGWTDCHVRNGEIGLGLGMESAEERLRTVIVVVHAVHAAAAAVPVPERTAIPESASAHPGLGTAAAAGVVAAVLVLLVEHADFDASAVE